MTANTSKGITYPQSSDHTRLWEHMQTLATTADGTIWGNVDRQIFTSSGTWTRPANAIAVHVQVQGAGGGSGGIASTTGTQASCAPGGAGGEYAAGWLTPSTTGTSQAVTVGTGGAGGSAGANAGSTGGTSSFGTLITALGGEGSQGGTSTSTSVTIGGTNGATGGTGGDWRLAGGDGGNGQVISAVPVKFNNGGSSFLSNPRRATGVTSGTTSGFDGRLYGGGASGPSNGATQSAVAGSTGAAGIVIVTTYTA